MNALKPYLAEWHIWVISYIVSYLMAVGGAALSMYLWAAPFDDWRAIFQLLFQKALLPAIPFGLILGFAWHRRRLRPGA